MSDIEEIRHLLARYCHAADDSNTAAFEDCFAPDGVLVAAGVTIPRAKLTKMKQADLEAKSKMPQPTGSKHLTINSTIDVRANEARVLSDFLAFSASPNGWQLAGIGRYTDELVKTQGRWLIRSREITGAPGLPLNPANPNGQEQMAAFFRNIVND
jgi:hypothetical protein